ncbi:Rho termination factor N-terminal domain-containing protein [Granulosicoccus sp. 3-233]|uniref:Rho termination factor N-terminal domain-containing protein n=1 Tax=Granulosicoccus sp. 3-233 TaxID=3417969 RepID=UPI003D356437
MAKRIKKEDTYEALREEGASKQKAAAIANAQANDSVDHDSRPYEQRSVDELKELAREREIRGRSTMNKSQLIKALRDD